MNILLIDDEPKLLKFLARHLQNRGHHVEEAEDGQQGLEFIKQKTLDIDLILTDIKMPIVDGIQVLEYIRKEELDIPVILMTGHGELEMSIQALRLGAFDFMLKPFKLNTLDAILAKVQLLDLRDELVEILPYVHEQLEIKMPSQLKYINPTIAYLQTHFRALCRIHRIDSHHLTLCLQEALTNAIIHGNLEVPGQLKSQSSEQFYSLVYKREALTEYYSKKVTVRYSVSQKQPHENEAYGNPFFAINLEVEDEGIGFDTQYLIDPEDPATWLGSNNRGLLIIRSCMDEVSWNEEGNCMRMSYHLLPRESGGVDSKAHVEEPA